MREKICVLFLSLVMLIGTIAGCTMKEENIDIKDSSEKYHVQVDFKTNKVTLACNIDTPDADGEGIVENGTAEYWTVLVRACNTEQDPKINFDRISYNITYEMSKDFKKLFQKFWAKCCVGDDKIMDIDEEIIESNDAETISCILAFGELWDENPRLFPVKRPIVEAGSDEAVEIALMYEGSEKDYQNADADKDGYISAQEFVKFRINSLEEIADKYK